MKKYLYTIVFAAIILVLNQFVGINFFQFDFTKRVRHNLYEFTEYSRRVENEIVLLNIGTLSADELKAKIDTLLARKSTIIGVNVCHYDNVPYGLIGEFKDDERVVFTNCEDDADGSLSRLIEEGNTVFYYRADSNEYFEFKVANATGSGNEFEPINYGEVRFFKDELSLYPESYVPEFVKGKIVLLGYMGNFITEDMRYFKNSRITPLNEFYGESDTSPDLYDTEISAYIISNLIRGHRIKEIADIYRVLIIFLFIVVNVTLLTYIRTKWVAVNVIIALVALYALLMVGSVVIVFLFPYGYYLNLDELTLVLLITSAFTFWYNIREGTLTKGQSV